jgi:hypothetical protein
MACEVTPVRVPRLSTIPNSHDYEQWSGKSRRAVVPARRETSGGPKGELAAISGCALTRRRFVFT